MNVTDEFIIDLAVAHSNHKETSATGIEFEVISHARIIEFARALLLSTLPIAVEEKDGLVPAKAAEFSRMVREYRANSDNDHGARMQEDLEMFLMENLCEIEAALISSPGKDGGQEVEAVGEAAELARLRAIALDMQAGYVEATERAEEAVKAANALQAEVDRLRDTRPQPASTALVESLAEELTAAASLLETLSEELPDDDVSGVMMRVMAERNRSALSASTSREGEI